MSKRRASGPGGTGKRGRTEDKYLDIVEGVYELREGGHEPVELFTELPSAELYPDYRDVVEMPISMAEISKRARLHAYDTDDDLLGDLEQMMENAKLYNGEGSPVVDDATAILDYVLGRLGRPPSDRTRQKQQAKILHDLITYKYKGRRLSEVFMVEPDKKEYPSYYEVVKKATSFTTVQEQIKELPVRTWPAFEKLVDLIFQNAMLFNQEESQIYIDAKSLSRQLHNKIQKLTSKVQPPTAARQEKKQAPLKLRLRVANSDSEGSDGESEEVVETRFDDEDDEDFEAEMGEGEDDDDEEEEGVPEDDDDEEMGENGAGAGSRPLVPQIIVRDELTHRELGKTIADSLLQLVTITSQPYAPYIQASQNILKAKAHAQAQAQAAANVSTNGTPAGSEFSPSPVALPTTVSLVKNGKVQQLPAIAKDMVQIRVPAPRKRTLTAFSTTLPHYHHTLILTPYLNERLRSAPHSLNVILNGRKLAPMGATLPAGVPMLREDYEIHLSPGLNQVTVGAVSADATGAVRPFGPPPVEGALQDEERMIFWLNLTR